MNQNVAPYWDAQRVSSFIETVSLQNLPQNHDFNSSPKGLLNMFRRVRPGMFTAFLSGSKAEFFIEPLINGHYGDIDIMLVNPFMVAYVGGCPPMPYDVRGFGELVLCLQITSTCDFPGFCQLTKTGTLEFSWETGKYQFVPRQQEHFEDYVMPHVEMKDKQLDLQQVHAQTLTDDSQRRGLPLNLLQQFHLGCEITGPSLKLPGNELTNHVSVDRVHCFWCPEWPAEANEWPIRHRKFDWPTKATIQIVVKGGCHFVPVFHPDCPEEKRNYQFRFSFSHAELVLIRSWTPVQQVVYHILRYFCKELFFRRVTSKEDELLTGYHLKTTMLWVSENNPITWWHSAPVIVVLSQILSYLGNNLRRKNIPNYFMPHVNLLRKKLNAEIFEQTLDLIDHASDYVNLNDWFLRNYVTTNYWISMTLAEYKVKYKGKDFIDIAFKKVMKVITTPDATPNESDMKSFHVEHKKKVNEERLVRFEKTLLRNFFQCMSQNVIFNSYSKYFLTELDRLRNYVSCSAPRSLTEKLGQDSNDISLPINVDVFLKAVYFQESSEFRSFCSSLLLLRIESSVSCKLLNYHSETVVDLLRGIPMETKTMCSKSHNYPHTYRLKLHRSHVLLLRAEEIMETITFPTRDAEFWVMSQKALELLRQCASTHRPNDEYDSIRTTAVVYMAALYYAALDIQTTTRLCLLVTFLFDQRESLYGDSEIRAKSMNAFCLLFIDDVARIVGLFLVLKRHKNPLFFAKQRLHCLLRITPRVFAEYLLVLAKENCLEFSDLLRWSNPSSFYILDALILQLVIAKRRRSTLLGDSMEKYKDVRRCVYLRTDLTDATLFKQIETIEENTTNLVFEWCLDEMTEFSAVVLDRWGMVYNPVDCYRVLYLYKCGRYMESKTLCTNILLADDDNTTSEWSSLWVTVLPPFDGFFDKDIQFLLGLQTLCLFCYPMEEEFKVLFEEEPDYLKRTAGGIKCGLILSVSGSFLSWENNLYGLRRHFLARYLMLKIAVATGHSRSSVSSAFRQMKSRLHFERVIHKYICERLKREFQL